MPANRLARRGHRRLCKEARWEYERSMRRTVSAIAEGAVGQWHADQKTGASG
jgi:hypothetical protein